MAKSDQAGSGTPSEDVNTASSTDLVELKAKVETQIGQLVSGKSRDQVIERVFQIVQSEAFRGPLPHPKHLAAYNEILPGCAERIVSMAESALRSNINVAMKAQADDSFDRRLGMWLGFSALMTLIVCAMICVFLHEIVAAGIFLGIGACGVVVALIKGGSSSNNS